MLNAKRYPSPCTKSSLSPCIKKGLFRHASRGFFCHTLEGLSLHVIRAPKERPRAGQTRTPRARLKVQASSFCYSERPGDILSLSFRAPARVWTGCGLFITGGASWTSASYGHLRAGESYPYMTPRGLIYERGRASFHVYFPD